MKGRAAMTLHVHPIGDLIEHELEGAACVCGPRVEMAEARGGGSELMIVHNSLDGRELRERGGDVRREP